MGQLFQIVTSTEIPSWKRPQNYKVWQLATEEEGKMTRMKKKYNNLKKRGRAAI
jgi:hypothetical protein